MTSETQAGPHLANTDVVGLCVYADKLTFYSPANFSCLGSLCKTKLYSSQPCLYCAPDHLVPIFVLYIDVYVNVTDKPWCEYELNQTTDYAVYS